MFTFVKNNLKYILLCLTIIIIYFIIYYYINNNNNNNLIFTGRELQLYEIEPFISPNFPPIRQFKNIFSDEECQQIIDISLLKLVNSGVGTENIITKERTSQQAWLDRTELSCLKRASEQIAKLVGIPVENQEKWQVIRYKQNQHYNYHFDACNEETGKHDYETCIADNYNRGWGHRLYTFLIYLNNVDEGGETHFPLLNKKFKPKKNCAILWNNLTDDQSKSHPYSKHAGMPVIKGTKWAINVWIRQYPTKD